MKADGFRAAEKKFVLTEGNIYFARAVARPAMKKVDGVTRATGTSPSDGVGSVDFSRYIVYNSDLVINAFCLKAIGRANRATRAVWNMWNNQYYPTMEVANGGERVYSFLSYADAVQEAETDGYEDIIRSR